MKKKIRNILMLLFFVIFVVSAWNVYHIRKDYRTGSDTYSSLTQYISFEETFPASSEDNLNPTQYNPINSDPVELDDTIWPNIDFNSLASLNSDIVGWLYIEGTNINYPIVQGTDNSYYLKHLFDGTYNSSGCIFLDANSKSDFTEMNSVIYGHHMKNGTMFYDLMEFKNQEFYDEYPYALLVTPDHKYKNFFFSAYVSRTSSSAWNVDFSDVGYEEWLSELIEKSCFTANVVPVQDDRVITLSTCSYEFNNARFVVHGILQEFS